MSIFDEMVSILQEINAKLGENAGDKAAAIDIQKEAPAKDPYQKNEEYIGLNISIKSLIKSLDNFADKQQFKQPVTNQQNVNQNPFNTNIAAALRNAVSNIPGMGNIITQIGMLSKIFDTVTKTFDTVMKTSYVAAASKSIITNYTSAAFSNNQNRSKSWGGGQPTNKNTPNQGFKDVFNFLHLKNAFKDVFNFLHLKNTFKDVFNFLHLKNAFQNIGKMFTGPGSGNAQGGYLQQSAGNIGKFFGSFSGNALMLGLSKLTPAVIGSLLIAPALVAAGLVAVGAGLIKFAKSLVESDRAISMYNPATAVAWTLKDITNMFLDMTSAKKRGPSQQDFLATWAEFNVAIRPILDDLVITFTRLGTALLKLVNVLLKLVNGLLSIYNKLPPWAKKVFLVPLGTIGSLLAAGSEPPAGDEPPATIEQPPATIEQNKRFSRKLFDYYKELSLETDDTKFHEGIKRLELFGSDMPDPIVKQAYKDVVNELTAIHEGKNPNTNPTANDALKITPVEGNSYIERQLKALNDALKAFSDEYKKNNQSAEIVDVGQFMAGVVNSPLVYNAERDRAFDYTNAWNTWDPKRNKK